MIIEKKVFCQAIESIEQQHLKDKINSKLIQEAFNAKEDFLYDTSLIQNQLINLLSMWFDKDDLVHFCYFENFGKLNEESFEDFYDRLMKTK